MTNLPDGQYVQVDETMPCDGCGQPLFMGENKDLHGDPTLLSVSNPQGEFFVWHSPVCVPPEVMKQLEGRL